MKTELELEHSDMVRCLKKPGHKIQESLSPNDCDALHMAIGIVGEGGELIDQIKRHTIYQKPLDRENLVEELGDLEFYMEGLRQRFNVSREETLEGNLTKLLKGERARYKSGTYSNEQAQERADKK